jgi:hypothetical protein
MRISGSLSESAALLQSLTFNGVTLTTHYVQLGESAVVIALKLTNSNTETTNVDVECDADLNVDGRDDTPCWDLGDGRGFYVEGVTYGFTFIGRSYPLVHNVSTYWFGSLSDRLNNYWIQSTGNYTTGDSGCAWSWQDLSIPAGDSVSVSLIVKSGRFDGIEPILKLLMSDSSIGLCSNDSLHLTGIISGVFDPFLLFHVDDDFSSLSRINESISSQLSFDLDISLKAYHIGPGSQILSFYVVDGRFGRVSKPQKLIVRILDSTPFIPVGWGSGSSSFEIFGIKPTGSYASTSSTRGYATRMRIAGSISSIWPYNGALQFNGVTLTSHFTLLGGSAVLIAFRLANNNSVTTSVDVECDTDLYVDGRDSAPISDLGNNQGFIMQGTNYNFTLIGRSYPLVRDVSSYWFGHYSDRTSNYWIQSTTNYYTGDSGCTWSWQGISIPAGQFSTISLIMKSGQLIPGNPILRISKGAIPPTAFISDSITVRGFVHDFRSHSLIDLYAVFDSDLLRVFSVRQLIPSGSEFNCSIILLAYNLTSGVHQLSIYAVDHNCSRVSPGQQFEITLLNPNLTFPMSWRSSSSFDLIGTSSTGSIITSSGDGYATRFRVNGTLSDICPSLGSITLNGVTLSINLTHLGENAILVSFRIANSNSSAVNVDIESDVDLLVDNNVIVTCSALNESRGFSINGTSHSFTVIGRSYPLVKDISTYWFGYYDSRTSNYWIQSTLSSYNGDSGFTWSWQQLSIPSGQFVSVSLIVRSGPFVSNSPELTMSETSIPDFLPILELIHIVGRVNISLPIDLFLVIDNDVFSIHRLLTSIRGPSFSFWLQLSTFNVSLGRHILVFYAVDIPHGRVSLGVEFFTTLIPMATSTRSHSPTLTSTPTLSHSPTPTATVSHSPTPTATASHSPTPTLSHSPPPTPTVSHSPTPTATVSHSPTSTLSHSPPPTATVSHSPTPTLSHSPSPTASVSHSPTPTASVSISAPFEETQELMLSEKFTDLSVSFIASSLFTLTNAFSQSFTFESILSIPNTVDASSGNTVLIAAAVGGSLLFILLIILGLFFVCRARFKAGSSTPSAPPETLDMPLIEGDEVQTIVTIDDSAWLSSTGTSTVVGGSQTYASLFGSSDSDDGGADLR